MVKTSLALTAAVGDWDPGPLVEPSTWRAVTGHVLDRAAVASSYYLETRLGPEASRQVDLLVCIGRTRRHALRASSARATCPGVARLSEQWSNRTQDPLSEVSALWLEYDDIRAASSLGTPSVSTCLVSDYLDCRAPLAPTSPASQMALLVRVSDLLAGAPAQQDRERLQRCVEALPRGGRMLQFSKMLGRPNQPGKLYIRLPTEDLRDYLRAVGWRGSNQGVSDLVGRYFPQRRTDGDLYLDLTLDDLEREGGNKVGLVHTPQHLAGAEEVEPTWARTLHDYIEAGLCTPGQQRALSRWPSRLNHRSGGTPRHVERWLDLKLVLEPSGEVALKAYLGVSTRPATAFDLRAETSKQAREDGQRRELRGGVCGPAGARA